MPQIVEIPGGVELEFPDGMPEGEMMQLIEQNFPDVFRSAPAPAETEPELATDSWNVPAEVPEEVPFGQPLRRLGSEIAQVAATGVQGLQRFGETIQPFTPFGAALGLIPGAKAAQQGLGEGTRQFARDVQERAAEDYGVDPSQDQAFSYKLIKGAASIVPVLASGGTMAPLMGAAIAGESARQDAEAEGGTEFEKDTAFWGNAIVGAIGEKILGVPKWLKMAREAKIPDGTLKEIVKAGTMNAVKAAPMEASQEAIQTLAENWIARDIAQYDQQRELGQGVGEAAAIGALVGGGVGGVTGTAGAIDSTRRIPTEAELEGNPDAGTVNIDGKPHAVQDEVLKPVEPESTKGKAIRSLVGDEALATETTTETATETIEPASTPTQSEEISPSPQIPDAEPSLSDFFDVFTEEGRVRSASRFSVPFWQETQGETQRINKSWDEGDAPKQMVRAVAKAGIRWVEGWLKPDGSFVFDQTGVRPTWNEASFGLRERLYGRERAMSEYTRINQGIRQDAPAIQETETVETSETVTEPQTETQGAIQEPEATAEAQAKIAEARAKVPSHLVQESELESLLTTETPVGTQMRSPEAPEGGAFFSKGGRRKTTPAVGLTPKGSNVFIRIPGVLSRLTKGLERHGAADVLATQKNPIGKLLGRMTAKHVDTEQELYGQQIKHFTEATEGWGTARKKKAFQDAERFIREKENGRPIPAISPDAKKLITAWENIAEETGNIARANNVQVFDAKIGKHRPMGNLGRNYIPRVFRQDVERVLSDPQQDPTLFNDLAQAIATHRGVSIDVAAQELRGVASRFQASDFMGNLELARSEQLPEVFYEYDLRNLASRYIPGFSERMGQIIAYGQRLGPRDAPQRKNLWDIARAESEDTYSQNWLKSAEDQATNFHARSTEAQLAKRAQTLANAVLLSDPTGTVLRNLLGGLSSTTEIFGLRRSLAPVIQTAVSAKSRMDAKEIGAVRDNIAEFLHADQLGQDFADEVIRTITDKALTWSGYQGSEVFVRTHAALVASQYAMDAAKAISKPRASGLAKESLAMFKRWNIDPAKIQAEKGDWKTGPESRKFIRTAIREMQGGYRFDQVPLWANSAVGRFFYQYGRWGVQRARNLARNVVRPAVGEEINWHGKTMVVRNLKPLLRAGVALTALGEVYALVALGLFDRDRKDASFHEIQEAFQEDAKLGIGLALERGLNDIIMAGSLGIWGQPLDFFKKLKDQSRFKNPAEPPSLAGVKAIVDLSQRALDQEGKLTFRDWMMFAGQMARGAKNITDVARNVMNEPLYEAENDVRSLRMSARRWAERRGMDVTQGPAGDIRKSVNAPFYEPIQEALLVGDSNKAERLAQEFYRNQKDSSKAQKNLMASVRSRQPFRAGPYYSEVHQNEFFTWATRNLSPEDLDQARRIQDRYVAAARRAGLWSSKD